MTDKDKNILGKMVDNLRKMSNVELQLLSAFSDGLVAGREIMNEKGA